MKKAILGKKLGMTQIFDENRNEVKRDVFHVTWDADAAEKEGYDHFMMKEIFEQPKGLSETLNRRLDETGKIVLEGITMTKEDIEKFSKVYIVAKDKKINAKSIMGMMSLGFGQGDKLTIQAEGNDAEAAVKEIADYIESVE